jgi:hypothetical protein
MGTQMVRDDGCPGEPHLLVIIFMIGLSVLTGSLGEANGPGAPGTQSITQVIVGLQNLLMTSSTVIGQFRYRCTGAGQAPDRQAGSGPRGSACNLLVTRFAMDIR